MYDVVIIGAGPAGLTASIYCSCFHLSHVTIGKVFGGQMSLAPDILNYPGFLEVTGAELTERMIKQATDRGVAPIMESVIKISKIETGFLTEAESGKTYESKTVILATGTERKKLNVPGEVEYTGRGIQYCVSCERFDYKDKIAAVVGGANSAAQSAVQLSHAASKVYIIYRGSELRCDPIWLEQIKNEPKIEILYNSTPIELTGDGQKLTGIRLKLGSDSQTKDIQVDKLYIEIGGVPGTALLIPLGVEMDEGGYIKVNEKLETTTPGVFAAGDVVSHKFSFEQITSAVGSAARAATSVFSYLKQQKAPTLWGAIQIQRPQSKLT